MGAIISTVTDIAEQSNLLSLNAAIESVSAGEQGRRFGVVAAEMKALAGQAKDGMFQAKGHSSGLSRFNVDYIVRLGMNINKSISLSNNITGIILS